MGWKGLVIAAFWLGAALVSLIDSYIVEIQTSSSYQHNFLEDDGVVIKGYTYITFLLRAATDGHVSLSSDKTIPEAYAVVIGGWGSKKSVIRRCHSCLPSVVATHPTGVISNEELRPFWISWAQGHIRVGRGLQVYNEEFMSFIDSDPHQINHIGVSTGWGSTGTWIFTVIEHTWMILEPSLSHVNTSVLQDNDDATCLTNNVRAMTLTYNRIFAWNFEVNITLSPECEHLRRDILSMFTTTDVSSPSRSCQLSGALLKCKHRAGVTYACKCTTLCHVYVKAFQPGTSTDTGSVCDISL